MEDAGQDRRSKDTGNDGHPEFVVTDLILDNFYNFFISHRS